MLKQEVYNLEKKYGLSQTEYEIMQYLWDLDKKLFFRDILTYFNTVKNKNWKKQTLNTFLRILQDNSLVSAELQINKMVYYPACSREELAHNWSHKFLESSFNDSFVNFFKAFTMNEQLKQEDVEYLQSYLKKFEYSK